jgi:hypothetical protein
MFDLGDAAAEELCVLVDALGEVRTAPDARGMLNQVEALERIKCAAAAAQARITSDFDDDRQSRHPKHAVPDASLGAEIGIACHRSPHYDRRKLNLSRALVDDLPYTLAALANGDIDEHRAEIIATGTSDLTREDRVAADAEIATEARALGDRELQMLVQRVVYRIDEAGAVRRREQAQARRRVSKRNLGDGTGQINAVVSDIHAAAIMNSLSERAALERKLGLAGDRSPTQLIADIFVERLTGQSTSTALPVNIDLVVSAETLFGDDDEPADIPDCGPVPASVAREMVIASPEERTRIRRLFRFDETDRLVAMESTSRTFRGLATLLIRIRDRICRSPYCNARIRHGDHVTPVHAGGETTADNAQGLCEACNQIKESPGWRNRTVSGPFEQHEVEIITPTGHTIRSRAPAPPRPPQEPRWVEVQPGRWVLAA